MLADCHYGSSNPFKRHGLVGCADQEKHLSSLWSIGLGHGRHSHVAGLTDGGELLALGVDDAQHEVLASSLQPSNLLGALQARLSYKDTLHRGH